MRKARYYDKEQGAYLPVHASEYNEAVHGKDLLCADPCCTAKMRFRKEIPVAGRSHKIEATFVSHSRKDHHPECSALKVYDYESNGVSLNSALASGLPVLANINFATGHPRAMAFGNRYTARDIKTAYNIWRAENKHGTEALGDLTELFAFVEKMRAKGALSRLFFGHAQRILEYEHLDMDGEGNLADLFRKLRDKSKGDRWADKDVDAHPRLLTFRPIPGRFSDADSPNVIDGFSVTLLQEGDKRVELVNRLVLSNAFWRDEVRMAGSVRLMATPVFRRSEYLSAVEAFRAGAADTKVYLRWMIEDRGQMQLPDPSVYAFHAGPQGRLFPVDGLGDEGQHLAHVYH